MFDDHNGSRSTTDTPDAGIKVPDTNTQIVLESQANGGKSMNVVRPAS